MSGHPNGLVPGQIAAILIAYFLPDVTRVTVEEWCNDHALNEILDDYVWFGPNGLTTTEKGDAFVKAVMRVRVQPSFVADLIEAQP